MKRKFYSYSAACTIKLSKALIVKQDHLYFGAQFWRAHFWRAFGTHAFSHRDKTYLYAFSTHAFSTHSFGALLALTLGALLTLTPALCHFWRAFGANFTRWRAFGQGKEH